MNSATEAKLRIQLAALQHENARLQEQSKEDAHSRLIVEQELGKTEDRLSLALDAAGLAMWEWDMATQAIYTSVRFAEMVNDFSFMQGNGQVWPPEEIQRKLYGEDRNTVNQQLVRVFKQQDKRLDVEFRVRTAAGVRWLECTGEVTQRDMLGFAVRMVGIARDITRRKQVQHEMETARALAVAANSAKDDFLAHISHEIRTPLNGVIGMNNLLAQSDLQAEQRQYVDLVASSGRALLALVNDVLDYSRLQAQKLILEQVRFPLNRWLWEVVTPLRVTAEGKGLELSLRASDDVPQEAVGDPGRLRQILTNLLSNAIKFTEQGQIEVSMRSSPGFQGRMGLRIEVADTGIGIPLEMQQSIFGAFVQADSSTSRRYGGSGLGLAISMKLAQMMGGRIDLDSAPGRGSRFVLHVPLGIPRADTPNTQFGLEDGGTDTELARLVQASPPLEQPSQFPGKRALVVDDHSVNRLLATKLLEQLGFEVAAAENGDKAVQAVRSTAFDLVLMDIQMPVMNGWQATHHIRQWEQAAGKTRVPIVALSAHASAADREQALASGMDGYLSKPLTPEALQAALRATRLAFKASRMETVPRPDVGPETVPLQPLHGLVDSATPGHLPAAVLRASAGGSRLSEGASRKSEGASRAGPLSVPAKVSLHSRQKMLNRLAGNEDALREMALAFCQDLRNCMGQAYAAVNTQDWPVVAAQAHALKGLLLSMTAEAAAAQAKALEQAAKRGDAAGVTAIFKRLSEAAKETFDAVKTW